MWKCTKPFSQESRIFLDKITNTLAPSLFTSSYKVPIYKCSPLLSPSLPQKGYHHLLNSFCNKRRNFGKRESKTECFLTSIESMFIYPHLKDTQSSTPTTFCVTFSTTVYQNRIRQDLSSNTIP